MVRRAEEIRVQSLDLTLRGEKSYPSGFGEPPYPTVLMCHGIGSDIDNYGLLRRGADIFNKAGFLVVRYNYGCHGTSDGRFRDTSPIRMVHDLNSMLIDTASQPDVDLDRFFLYAHSLSVPISFAARPDLVKAMFLSGAHHDAYAMVKAYFGDFFTTEEGKFSRKLIPLDDGTRKVLRLGSQFWPEAKGLHEAIMEGIAHGETPAMLARGSSEEYVPIDQIETIQSLWKGPIEYVEIEGANHDFEEARDRRWNRWTELFAKSLEFYGRFL